MRPHCMPTFKHFSAPFVLHFINHMTVFGFCHFSNSIKTGLIHCYVLARIEFSSVFYLHFRCVCLFYHFDSLSLTLCFFLSFCLSTSHLNWMVWCNFTQWHCIYSLDYITIWNKRLYVLQSIDFSLKLFDFHLLSDSLLGVNGSLRFWVRIKRKCRDIHSTR